MTHKLVAAIGGLLIVSMLSFLVTVALIFNMPAFPTSCLVFAWLMSVPATVLTVERI